MMLTYSSSGSRTSASLLVRAAHHPTLFPRCFITLTLVVRQLSRRQFLHQPPVPGLLALEKFLLALLGMEALTPLTHQANHTEHNGRCHHGLPLPFPSRCAEVVAPRVVYERRHGPEGINGVKNR